MALREIDYKDLVEDSFQSTDDVEFNYPKRDFHTQYVGLIKRVLVDE